MKILEPAILKNRKVINRFIRSATCEYLSDENGKPDNRFIDLYRKLSDAGIGIVISGYSYVMENGKSNPGQSGIYSDQLIPSWKEVTRVFQNSPSLFLLQIVHGGRQVRPKTHSGPIWAPSAVADPVYKTQPREMSLSQIQEVRDAFVRSSVRAEGAGFDGIQLHAAHGYLLSQFISPYTNRRNDGYGGDQKKRTRLIVEIIREIKKRVSKGFIICAKMNGEDWLPGGLTVTEAAESARLMREAGLDLIEVSGGMGESKLGPVRKNIAATNEQGYFRDHARTIRRETGLPTAVVGGFRALEVMEDAIQSGDADFVSLSRPFIREPNLVFQFESQVQKKTSCVSCNRCFNPRGIKCWQDS